jgi:hypothetical protein
MLVTPPYITLVSRCFLYMIGRGCQLVAKFTPFRIISHIRSWMIPNLSLSVAAVQLLHLLILPLPFTNVTSSTSLSSAASDLQRMSVQELALTRGGAEAVVLRTGSHPQVLGTPAYRLLLRGYYHASFLRTPAAQDLHIVKICTYRPTDMETMLGTCLLPARLVGDRETLDEATKARCCGMSRTLGGPVLKSGGTVQLQRQFPGLEPSICRAYLTWFDQADPK